MMYGRRAEIAAFEVASGSTNTFGLWVVWLPMNTPKSVD